MKASPLRHPARLAGSSLLRLQSDMRLAELVVAGHEAAFDAIVDRYRTPLTRYCAGIVGPSRAEDAVQQALINAHDALQRTDEVRHLRSWLYRIAHNASLNVLRALRDEVPLDDASVHVAAASSDGPAESFERSERFRATVAALQELPERQRAALLLRELEGRSHEEIAAALGVTTGSARQHLMRARIAVRGAVTAVTPYPLIARLSEMLTTGGGAGAGWADAAVGAGAGATLAKFTAGVAATGALVGGAVGGSHVVHHGDGGGGGAAAREGVTAQPKRVVKAVSAAPAKAAARAVTAAPASVTSTSKAPPHAPRRSTRHATQPTASRHAPITAPAPPQPSSAGPVASSDVDTHQPNRGSSAKQNRDHSNSSGHQREDVADDKSNKHADSGSGSGSGPSDSKSSGKGHAKPPADEPKHAKTKTKAKPTTTTPSDDDSSGPGSGSGESKKSDAEGSNSGSGKPTSTTEAEPASGKTTGD
jgi:RNA polymerase sigma factor (sigma-70 family)